MRVIVMVKATKNSEASAPPTAKLLEDMGKYNEELLKAGIMLAGDGLKASSLGKRVRFSGSGGKRTVIDGPFAETKELLGGFAVMELSGFEETIEMCRRYTEILGGTLEIDVRLVDVSEEEANAAS